MTDKIKNEINSVNEERKAILYDIDKFKESYAKYIISDQDSIKEGITHPYVITKKDVRKKKITNFFNKVKKALGI